MNPYINWVNFYANAYGVDPELARRIALRESNYDPNAVSSAGARGIMQLMPGTAKDMGVDPNNPEQNIKGGIKYYAMMRDEFGPVMGLAGYNWGPGNLRKYLKGDIKNMPEETQKYLAELGPYADSNYKVAPMDLQGNPYPPTVLPTSSNTQEVIPPQRPGDMKMNDEYESMKVFNPYIQMALGILAGNSGVNKSQAFSNAMGGGLGALNAAERSQAYAQQTRAQNEALRMKRDEYEKMQQRIKYMQDYSAKRLADPNLDPDERIMWELGQQGDIDSGIKLMSGITGSRDKEAMRELKLREIEARAEAAESKMQGGRRYPVPVPEGHPFTGYSVDDKGEVFDPSGVKLTGTRRDYFSEMTSKPADQILPFNAWKNKQDPNQMILPEKYGRWINPKGERLNESIPQSEAVDRGYRFVTEKQATDIDGTLSAVHQLKTMEDMLFGPNGVYRKNSIPDITEKPAEALGSLMDRYTAGMGFGKEDWQDNVRMYNDAVEGFSSQLSKLQGQVGTLTEKDVQKAINMLPKLTPNINPFSGDFRLVEAKEKEASKKMQEVRQFLRSKGVDPDLIWGEATGSISTTPGGVKVKGLD